MSGTSIQTRVNSRAPVTGPREAFQTTPRNGTAGETKSQEGDGFVQEDLYEGVGRPDPVWAGPRCTFSGDYRNDDVSGDAPRPVLFDFDVLVGD